MDLIAGASPRQLARVAGGLYLINIVGGAFGIGVVPAMVVVSGDAAPTAHSIQTHEQLYRLGLVAHVVVTVTNVPLAVIFYDLFKVVNRRLALLVVFFTLVGTAVEAAGLVDQFAPLVLLGSEAYTSALPVAQVQLPALLGEGSLCLWLLVVGVDVEGWKERASAAIRIWFTPVEALA